MLHVCTTTAEQTEQCRIRAEQNITTIAACTADQAVPHPIVVSCCVALQVGSYTNFFADALIAEAERDSRIVAVHAAMAGGTGLSRCVCWLFAICHMLN